MQWHLSKGLIGRVLVDRNTAFYFLDKSGLKRNRQIRLIRYVDYPMYYYLAHVNKGVSPAPILPPNGTKDSNIALAECGPKLREDSTKLVSESKETARNRLIPAELQVDNLWFETLLIILKHVWKRELMGLCKSATSPKSSKGIDRLIIRPVNQSASQPARHSNSQPVSQMNKGWKFLKKLWCCVGGGNKVIWLYQLSWKCKLATVTS